MLKYMLYQMELKLSITLTLQEKLLQKTTLVNKQVKEKQAILLNLLVIGLMLQIKLFLI